MIDAILARRIVRSCLASVVCMTLCARAAEDKEHPLVFGATVDALGENAARFRYFVVNRSDREVMIRAGGVQYDSVRQTLSVEPPRWDMPSTGGGTVFARSTHESHEQRQRRQRVVKLLPGELFGVSRCITRKDGFGVGGLTSGQDVSFVFHGSVTLVNEDGTETQCGWRADAALHRSVPEPEGTSLESRLRLKTMPQNGRAVEPDEQTRSVHRKSSADSGPVDGDGAGEEQAPQHMQVSQWSTRFLLAAGMVVGMVLGGAGGWLLSRRRAA
jgi:hypothetical protein